MGRKVKTFQELQSLEDLGQTVTPEEAMRALNATSLMRDPQGVLIPKDLRTNRGIKLYASIHARSLTITKRLSVTWANYMRIAIQKMTEFDELIYGVIRVGAERKRRRSNRLDRHFDAKRSLNMYKDIFARSAGQADRRKLSWQAYVRLALERRIERDEEALDIELDDGEWLT